MPTKEPLICCLCSEPVLPDVNGWKGGHNAEPLAEGRCCQRCNDTKVIPARLVAIYRGEQKRQTD